LSFPPGFPFLAGEFVNALLEPWRALGVFTLCFGLGFLGLGSVGYLLRSRVGSVISGGNNRSVIGLRAVYFISHHRLFIGLGPETVRSALQMNLRWPDAIPAYH
jgi:hypothetical protein